MNVNEALKARKSVRAYLDKPVEHELILQVLEAASHAPSGVNSQPWQVAVVSGDTKLKIQQQLEQSFRDGVKGQMDYGYYPEEWKPPLYRKAQGLRFGYVFGTEYQAQRKSSGGLINGRPTIGLLMRL